MCRSVSALSVVLCNNFSCEITLSLTCHQMSLGRNAARRLVIVAATCFMPCLVHLAARRRSPIASRSFCLILPVAAADAGRQRLRKMYSALQTRPADADWPDRTATARLWRGLHHERDESTGRLTVQPNRFVTDGPLQTTLFFKDNPKVLQIVHDAQQQLVKPLVAELRNGLRARNRAYLDRGFWLPRDEALHIIVRVFSEHPSLLDEHERAAWQPVQPEQVVRLGDAIEGSLNDPSRPGGACAIALSLFGYALTDDGSFLILFEDHHPDDPSAKGASKPGSSLLALREDLGRVGESVLGTLNSRPKALIHMSIARLLELPPEEALDAAEKSHVRQTISKWRSALKARDLGLLGNNGIPTQNQLPNLEAVIYADELELVRDTTWMMTQRETYRKFRFGI